MTQVIRLHKQSLFWIFLGFLFRVSTVLTITRDLIKEPIVMNCGMVSSMDTAHVLRASSSQLHALTILNFVLSSQVNMVMGVVDNSYPLKYLGNL